MVLTEILVALSLTCAPCDTVSPAPKANLDEFIAQHSRIDEKGRSVTTDDILLPQSRSETTGKAIVIPKGSIMTSEAEAKKHFNVAELPKKKKRGKK